MCEDDAPLADRPASWPVSSTRDLHRDDWVVALREDVVARPGHPEDRFRRIVVEHPGAVMVLAVDDDERVLCLRQYRHAGQHDYIEIPAGLRDAEDEDPLETARRELREEAELQATDWRPLLSTFPSAGPHPGGPRDLPRARSEPRRPGRLRARCGEEAEMVTLWVPMAELLDAVIEGRVRQGPLAQAVLAYDVLRRRGALARE